MKLRKSRSGFALIASLILTTLLFSYSLSYFDIVGSDRRLVAVSEKMQKAEAVAEAGVEQALWEFSHNNASFASWSGTTSKTKTSSGFSTFGDYSVSVANYNTLNPVITSTSSYTEQGAAKEVRILCGVTKNQSFYDKAIKAGNRIDLSGNVTIDSYDSSLGEYDLTTNRTQNGDVETNSTADPAVQLTASADIFGSVGTGPGGVVDVYSETNNTITGAITHTTANTIPAITVPSSLASLSPSPDLIYNGTSNTTMNVNGTVNYKCGRMDLSGSAIYTFAGSGTVNLYLTGSTATSFRTTANAQLIVGAGVNLVIYADKAVRVTGNGILNHNGTQNTSSVQIFGTPTCDTVEVTGNGDLVGIINTPNALVRVNGNGDVYGAIVCDRYIGSGNGDLHYDTDLLNNGPGATYKLQWYSRAS